MANNLEYYRPQSLEEALTLLDEKSSGIHLLAGGTNLVVWMKQKVVRPNAVLDIKEIKELHGFQVDHNGRGTIGPLTTVREVVESCRDIDRFKNLGMAAQQLGSPVVRNRATIGGNLCAGSPAGDLSLALLSYDTQLVIRSLNGQRKIQVKNFFKGPGQVDMAPNELLTEIKIKAVSKRCAEGFYKLGVRKSLQCTIIGVAVTISPTPNDSDRIEQVTIALSAVAPTPIRAVSAESLLNGQKWDLNKIHEAAEIAADESSPISDIRASKEYRRDMVSVLTKRVLCEAWEKTRNNMDPKNGN
jgi:carbon-monoxide dehydrogenase medium subunit